jgi:hypothetical protein
VNTSSISRESFSRARIRPGRSQFHGGQIESGRLIRCSVDAKAIEDRRQWALDQTLALCRNASVPKEDPWISSVLDFLLVHGFFVIRKLDKKSPIGAVSAELSRPIRRCQLLTLCLAARRSQTCLVGGYRRDLPGAVLLVPRGTDHRLEYPSRWVSLDEPWNPAGLTY